MGKRKVVDKFYAIRKGKGVENIIVNTWSECSKLVLGYNAEYKSFKLKEDAEKYLKGEKIETKKKASSDKKVIRVRGANKDKECLKVYLDKGTMSSLNEKCSELDLDKSKAVKMLIEEWII